LESRGAVLGDGSREESEYRSQELEVRREDFALDFFFWIADNVVNG